jgi:SWI/SNF-related matrix-associated actin-dependent regulator 1 of chromatin subfamily A
MKLLYDSREHIFFCVSTYKEKDIPKGAGFRWNPEKKRWWTGDKEKALKLIEYADKETKEALEYIEKLKEKALAASRAVDADIEIPCPGGLHYLPFQKAGIAFALERDRVLIADQMGLGKTIQAIGCINAHPHISKVLIICPASLKLNWQRELEKWLVNRELSIQIISGSKNNQIIFDTHIYIINYDIFKKHRWLKRYYWDILIVDEAHYLKNPKTQRSREIYGYKKNNIEPVEAKRKLFLTGTPIVNRPIELYPLISYLGFYMEFWTYARRYCNAQKNDYGWDLSGASNLGELQEKLRTTIMIRRLKEDVLSELPPKIRQIIEVPAEGISAYIKRELSCVRRYEEHKAELLAERDLAKASDNEIEYQKAVERLRALGKIYFDEISKLRHDTAVAKLPSVIVHLEDMLENVDKIVVFAHHKDVIGGIMRAFPEISVKLTGDDSALARQSAVDEFQNNPEIRLFIGSITAAGVGITLTASSNVVFAELDWVPGNISQAEDRCHRISQLNSVLVQHLVVDGSLDAQLAKTVVKKQKVIDKALDKEIPQIPDDSFITEIHREDEVREEKAESLNASFTDNEKSNIVLALRQVASLCDGARSEDNTGFNKYDALVGKSLISQEHLTDKQAWLGKKIVKKYHRQIDEKLYKALFPS